MKEKEEHQQPSMGINVEEKNESHWMGDLLISNKSKVALEA